MSAHEPKHRFLKVMNHGGEAHTKYTVEFQYFRTKAKIDERIFITLKHAPRALSNKIYPTISKSCTTPEPWNRQHSTVVISKDTNHIVVGLLNHDDDWGWEIKWLSLHIIVSLNPE